jgi:hypothetical protein
MPGPGPIRGPETSSPSGSLKQVHPAKLLTP